jgi:hypothetical protein
MVMTATVLLQSQQPESSGPRPNQGKNYSPYADRRYATQVFWGDQHLHTSFSCDAGMVGDRLGPDDAFRFARGEQLRSSSGQLVRLDRPLDWLVVSEHAEYLGMAQALKEALPALLDTPKGKQWAQAFKKGGNAAIEAFHEMIADMTTLKASLPPSVQHKLIQPAWESNIVAAERNNKPGRFTAFIGFEWTQHVDGNNVHRVVVFRDGADRAKQVLPFSAFDSADVEDLWNYMAAYEQKTGGRALAIPHNSNISGGKMFAPKRWTGKPFDKRYAELRARFEPLVETSQSKGDSETTPQLSPGDDFANFERWNKANLPSLIATTPEMLPFNYVRSALKLGLAHQAKLGANPFKFGLVGGTDQHTSLATTRAENYFGVGTPMEPKPGRWKEPFMVNPKDPKLDTYFWEMAPGGLGGVWAAENTREAIWDAMMRRETYCTTGTRSVVRVFGGWDFAADDLSKPDPVWVEQGYARGVPMGGGLIKPGGKGKSPTFMIKAQCDPDGAYLDRVQIIKGWLDHGGQTHEKVIDVVWSGNRTRDPQTGKVPPVGNTVDVKKATWTNSIGAPILTAFWQDAEFDPTLHAFYYVRVIEIPTPSWLAYDATRFREQMPDYARMTVTNRAYTSPIWYSPSGK